MIRVNQEFLNYIRVLKSSEKGGVIETIEARPTERIIGQRAPIFAVYIVQKGLGKCYLTEDSGKDFIQEFFSEGEIFGEIEMFNNDLSFCAVEALTDMVIFKIKKEHFYELLEQDKKFNRLVLKLLAAKVRYTALRHSFNQSYPIETKLVRLREQVPQLTSLISKTDLANYLGITERSLNRTFNNLRQRELKT